MLYDATDKACFTQSDNRLEYSLYILLSLRDSYVKSSFKTCNENERHRERLASTANESASSLVFAACVDRLRTCSGPFDAGQVH